MNLNRRKRGFDQLFEGSAKEHLNQEMVWNYRNLINCQSNDDRAYFGTSSSQESSLPVHRERVGFGVLPYSYDPTLLNSGFNCLMAPNTGSNMLRRSKNYNSHYFQKFSQDDCRGSTVPVAFDGKGLPSLEDSRRIYGEIVSPEQISSVTRSFAECQAPLVVGAVGVFPEPPSACLPDSTPLWFREDTGALSSMPYSTGKLRHEQLPHYDMQALTSEHYRRSSRPPAHGEIPLGTQMYGCRIEHKKLHSEVPVGRSEKPSHLSCEQLHSFKEKGSTTTQASRLTDSTGFLQNILACYLKSKSNLGGHEIKKEFVNHLHLSWCKIGVCECKRFCDLISHFHSCHNTHCKLCQPVRLLGYDKKISSGPTCEPFPVSRITLDSEKPNGYVSRDLPARDYVAQDKMPPSKRMKTENAGQFDDWSLFAVIRPHHVGGLVNDEDSQKKMNKEPLSSKDESRTGNATVNIDGGSMWSAKIDELSGLGQSSVSHINSAPPIGVPKSMGNLGNHLQTVSDASDLCNIKLRTDAVISQSEEHNSIDELRETGLAEISKGKSDVTFCYQSSNSDSSCVHSQVGDHGKSYKTFNDTLDLDNTTLIEDCAISPYEEPNLVGEQQEIFCAETSKLKSDVTFSRQPLKSDDISVHPEESPIDGESLKATSELEHNRNEAKYDMANPDNQCGRKLDDLRASGASLTDFFTAEQIREHLCSLNQDINLKAGQECFSMPADKVGSDTCQLCALDKIMFTALDVFCTSCEVRIKHKSTYYYWTNDEGDARYFFCTVCFKNARGGNISCRGLSFTKSQLYKGKNTEENGEGWVQCDKCEKWQHQICALYNSERDTKGQVKYTCPFCRLKEIEAKGNVPVTPFPGAQDLPRTKLSDYIEQRLFRSLQQERKQRADLLGKDPEDVPGVSDLKVRVTLAVNKKLRVKQQFLDIIHNESYPTEFPYKSKVILLFQKVEGVDVCLFALYVQEFGSECGNPNKRSVYISYLDSVKYFRPDIKSATGVALRTFVYYEILIGYLDYCKRLGFLTCYIWSCPPLKGEDYILHCHPESQKRPNPNKLVQWYRKMLRKAKEENVVAGFTNFYDYFFVPNGDFNCKITASRLPYFDGDYWSRAIEDIAQSIEKDNGGESDRQLRNHLTKRTMKAMGHNDLCTDATKDILVMQKLGQKILPVKDEFIVIHLQFTCTICREAILSGSCWSCDHCSKFHLCDRCHELELTSDLPETHTGTHGDKHQLFEIPVVEATADTDDKDGVIENDLFNDRRSLLNFCERNYYRFDTLRRAKHSTMMILHHLHAPREAARQTICSVCNQNVVEGWHCETCSEFHVCDARHTREGDDCHVHKLVKHLKKSDSRKSCEQMQQERASEGETRLESEHMQQCQNESELRVMADLLEHANQCRSTTRNPCPQPECLRIKKMFCHTKKCKRRVVGGCSSCERVWLMLHMHSEKCKAWNCTVPRCMDIKNYIKENGMKM